MKQNPYLRPQLKENPGTPRNLQRQIFPQARRDLQLEAKKETIETNNTEEGKENDMLLLPRVQQDHVKRLFRVHPVEHETTKILITAPTPRHGTEPAMEGSPFDRLDTDRAQLLSPAGSTAVDTLRSSRVRNTEIERIDERRLSKVEEPDEKLSKWFNLKTLLARNSTRLNTRKIYPDSYGLVDGALHGKGNERARKNWARARYLWNLAKIAGAMNHALNERDSKIFKGLTFGEFSSRDKRRWCIHPQNRIFRTWQSISQVLVLYYVFINPYVFAFEIEMTFFNVMNIVIDILYAIDIVLHFFVGLQNNSTGDITWSHKKIFFNYLWGTFIPDLIAVLPFYLFDRTLLILKFLRVVRLSLILGLIDLVCEKTTFFLVKGSKSLKIASFVSGLVSLLFILCLFSHLVACLWIAIGEPTDPTEDTWLLDIPGFSFGQKPIDYTGGTITFYTVSLFQILTTLTTVGYGLAIGSTIREYLIAMLLEFFGILIFGYLMYKLKLVVASLEEAERKLIQKITSIEVWIYGFERIIVKINRVINKRLLGKVKELLNLGNMDDIPGLFLGNGFYKALPLKDKNKLLNLSFSHLKSTFHVIFDHVSDGFVTEALVNGEPRHFLAGETIIQRGKHPLGIYLLVKGQVLITGETVQNSFRSLNEGSYFGELSMVSEKCSPHSYIAKTACRCILIKKQVLQELERKFPLDIRKFKSLSYLRLRYFKYTKKDKENGTGQDDITHFLKRNEFKRPSFRKLSGDVTQMRPTLNEDYLSPNRLKKSSSFFAPSMQIEAESPLQPFKRRSNFKPRTLLPVNPLDGSSKMSDSEVESIASEESSDSGSELNDADDVDSDNSELNYSDVYPLESVEHMLADPSGGNQLIFSFEEQIDFYKQKLGQLHRQSKMEVDYYMKILNRKLREDFADEISLPSK